MARLARSAAALAVCCALACADLTTAEASVAAAEERVSECRSDLSKTDEMCSTKIKAKIEEITAECLEKRGAELEDVTKSFNEKLDQVHKECQEFVEKVRKSESDDCASMTRTMRKNFEGEVEYQKEVCESRLQTYKTQIHEFRVENDFLKEKISAPIWEVVFERSRISLRRFFVKFQLLKTTIRNFYGEVVDFLKPFLVKLNRLRRRYQAEISDVWERRAKPLLKVSIIKANDIVKFCLKTVWVFSRPIYAKLRMKIVRAIHPLLGENNKLVTKGVLIQIFDGFFGVVVGGCVIGAIWAMFVRRKSAVVAPPPPPRPAAAGSSPSESSPDDEYSPSPPSSPTT